MTATSLREICFAEILDHYDLAPHSRLRGGSVIPAIERMLTGYNVRVIPLTGQQLRWFNLTADGVITKAPAGSPMELRSGRIVDIADAHEIYSAGLRVVTRLHVDAEIGS